MRNADATVRWGVARTAGVWVVGLLWALGAPLAAQLEPIGLATDGAQWFENDSPSSGVLDGERFGSALAAGDFDGDGVDDLATGVPNDGNDSSHGGLVVVRMGRRGGGLAGGSGTILRAPSAASNAYGWFGAALAAGDFNGDGFDDLAVGVPYDHWGPQMNLRDDRGAVFVFYGAPEGLSDEDTERLDELAGGVVWIPPVGALFGSALAAGNFDADPYDDLAIGVPWGFTDEGAGGGSVYVAHGSAEGLLPFSGYRISQDSFGIYDEAENGDRFGSALAAADFAGDGYDDLAIGVPGENDHSGAIEIVMGSQWGLIFANSVFWLPGALGETPQVGDRLGSALASGDFDGDGYADLAIGSPGKDLALPGNPNVISDTGAVDVAYGAADPFWFDLDRTDRLRQHGIHGNEAHESPGDQFGAALAAGDLDGDGRDDLAIGHPFDDWPGQDVGAVTVLMGAVPTIGSSTRHQLLGIGWEGVPGYPQQNQATGSALALGDFDGLAGADLAIGVPGLDTSFPDAGAEAILYSENEVFSDGFETGGSSRWSAVYH
jgi:FG-GAP repeat protein